MIHSIIVYSKDKTQVDGVGRACEDLKIDAVVSQALDEVDLGDVDISLLLKEPREWLQQHDGKYSKLFTVGVYDTVDAILPVRVSPKLSELDLDLFITTSQAVFTRLLTCNKLVRMFACMPVPTVFTTDITHNRALKREFIAVVDTVKDHDFSLIQSVAMNYELQIYTKTPELLPSSLEHLAAVYPDTDAELYDIMAYAKACIHLPRLQAKALGMLDPMLFMSGMAGCPYIAYADNNLAEANGCAFIANNTAELNEFLYETATNAYRVDDYRAAVRNKLVSKFPVMWSGFMRIILDLYHGSSKSGLRS